MRVLLSNRNFNLLFLSNLLVSLGAGISMIGIPWSIVKQDNGEWILGIMTLMPTIIIFILSPYWGVLTDRYDRRSILVFIDSGGFILLSSISLLSVVSSLIDIMIWLFIFYFWSILIFYLRIPVVIGMIKETVNPTNYSKANSLLEIIYQVAHVSAGAISIILLNKISISAILVLNTMTLGFAWLTVRSIHPQIKQSDTSNSYKFVSEKTVFHDLMEGYHYLIQRPAVLLFFLCAQLPSMVVIIGAYLFPLYVAHALQADGSVYAQGEVFYSIGAILAGFLVRKSLSIFNNQQIIALTVGIMAISFLWLTTVPHVNLYIILFLVIGFGNAGSRIAQITLMMEIIPQQLIGRIHSFLFFLTTFLRILLLLIFTISISVIGVVMALLIEGLLLVMAFFTVLYVKERLKN